MRVLLVLTILAAAHAETFWWKYAGSDCAYDDLAPQPACGGGRDVAKLEACCGGLPECGGFNSNGWMKKTDCQTRITHSPADLYIKESKPQPPPPPPAPPTVNFPPIWPYPRSFDNGTATIAVKASGFQFTCKQNIPTLNKAMERYVPITFPHAEKAPTGAAINELSISVMSEDESHPQLETDESYNLTIPQDGSAATLQAATIYGAMRGLETFSQLVQFSFSTQSYVVQNAPWTVDDAPRFPHRGLMMDTARHFEPLATIRQIVDSLPYAKLNVLHWHMVDSQSYPFESTTYPKLWNGAYTPDERYTQMDIASIVEYARERGVRVVVEFDMPGHAASWCAGYPEVCPSPSCLQPLNVANNATFDLIESVLGECTGKKKSEPNKPSGLFPDNFIHLGGDEVDPKCWGSTPAIAQWLKERNYTEDDGYAYFVKRAADIAIAQGRRPVQWVEVFDHFGTKLDKRTVVHVWKDEATLAKVVAAGYQALINNSPGSNSWYLDHLSITWDAVYGNEPCVLVENEAQCNLVLGGQGEMWGETADASDVLQTIWPKLAAIAERLWSPRAKITNAQAAHKRIETFRCLLNRRGVPAAPVNNPNAREAPPGPGSCYVQ